MSVDTVRDNFDGDSPADEQVYLLQERLIKMQFWARIITVGGLFLLLFFILFGLVSYHYFDSIGKSGFNKIVMLITYLVSAIIYAIPIYYTARFSLYSKRWMKNQLNTSLLVKALNGLIILFIYFAIAIVISIVVMAISMIGYGFALI